MPLWNVYHPVDAYSDDEKREFSDKVAGFYESRGVPRFYVMTLFREVSRGSFFVGGEPADNTMRVAIDHIARQAGDVARREETRKRIAAIIEPFASAKGLHWEYHVDHTPNDLWMIEGFVPPPANSDGEKLWAKENRAVPYGD